MVVVLTIITVLTAVIVGRKTREYRNPHARHLYEVDTCMTLKNMRREDVFELTSVRRDRTMIYIFRHIAIGHTCNVGPIIFYDSRFCELGSRSLLMIY